MTELRPIVADDLPRAAAFVIAGMRPELYPQRLDRNKVLVVLRAFIEPSRDRFQLAAFSDGRIVGGIAAAVMPMLWFERHEAHVVMCRATEPGVGRRKLRELKAWADADMRIRRVIRPLEFHADPRLPKVAARLGFGMASAVCTYNKE